MADWLSTSTFRGSPACAPSSCATLTQDAVPFQGPLALPCSSILSQDPMDPGPLALTCSVAKVPLGSSTARTICASLAPDPWNAEVSAEKSKLSPWAKL